MRVVRRRTTPSMRALGAVQRPLGVVRYQRGVTPTRRGAGIVAIPPSRPIVLRRRRRRPPIVGGVVPMRLRGRSASGTGVLAAPRGGGGHRVRNRPAPRPIRRQLRQRRRQLDPQSVPKGSPRQVVDEALCQSRLPRLVDVNRQGRCLPADPGQYFGEGDHRHDGRGVSDVRTNRGEHSQQPPGALLRQTSATTELRPHVGDG